MKLNEIKKTNELIPRNKWINPTEVDKLWQHSFASSDRHGPPRDKAEQIEVMQDSIADLFSELKEKGKLKLPLSYHASTYTYTITKVNPLKVVASDGAEVKAIKYFSDIGHYAEGFWADVFEMTPDWAQENFSNKVKDQGTHEYDQMMGNKDLGESAPSVSRVQLRTMVQNFGLDDNLIDDMAKLRYAVAKKMVGRQAGTATEWYVDQHDMRLLVALGMDKLNNKDMRLLAAQNRK